MCSILPSSLPCPRAVRGVPNSKTTGLLPASIFNPLGVFPDSMRAPPPRSSLARFLAKSGLPFREFDTFFHFLNTSRARVPKMAQNGPRSEKYPLWYYILGPFRNLCVLPERCFKNRSLSILIEFFLHCMLPKMCVFPSAGRIFSVGPVRFRPGVRTRAAFLEAPFEKRLFAREVLQKSAPMHFRLVFCCFLHRKNVHISSLGLIVLII